jgi:hypothetical protein
MWLSLISWGSKLLPILRSPKVLLSLSAATVCLLGYLYVVNLHGKVEELKESKATLAMYYDECQKANVMHQRNSQALQAANIALAESVRVSEEERIKAVREAVERALRAEVELNDTLESLEDMRNETPSCKKLSEVDMGAVCPAVVDRLRRSASGPD